MNFNYLNNKTTHYFNDLRGAYFLKDNFSTVTISSFIDNLINTHSYKKRV